MQVQSSAVLLVGLGLVIRVNPVCLEGLVAELYQSYPTFGDCDSGSVKSALCGTFHPAMITVAKRLASFVVRQVPIQQFAIDDMELTRTYHNQFLNILR